MKTVLRPTLITRSAAYKRNGLSRRLAMNSHLQPLISPEEKARLIRQAKDERSRVMRAYLSRPFVALLRACRLVRVSQNRQRSSVLATAAPGQRRRGEP